MLSSPEKKSLSSYPLSYHHKTVSSHKLGEIFFKNLSLMLLIIMVPILALVGISYYTMDNFLKSEISNYSSKFIKSLENTTDRVIDECISQMNYMVSDSDVSVFMQTEYDPPLFYSLAYLKNLVRIQLTTRDYLHSLYIYSDQSELVLSPAGLGKVDTLYDTNWLDLYLNHQGDKNVWIEVRDNEDRYSSITSSKILSIFMTANYGPGDTGVIVFNIDWDKFCSMISTDSVNTEDALGIVDTDLNLIADVYGDCETHLDQNTLKKLENSDSYYNTGSRVLYKVPFRMTDWNFVLSVPFSTYESDLHPMLTVILLIIAAGIFTTLVLAFFISLRIYRPFRTIIGLLQKPVGYVENEPIIQKDEETYILNSIRNTIQENEKISAELEKRIILLKQAQHIALQSQINPHFLYNTLDAINWMAMRLTGGRNDASVMISKLAAMLRYSLEDPESMVSLEMELNNVRTYLELQLLRYKGQFTVEWEVEPGLEQYRVIKLMIQPIVENAIYHGIRPLNAPGIIRICVHQIDECLTIEIKDTGMGIHEKLLEELNDSLQHSDLHHENHIGLHNVNQRIQLFFGEEYGVHIISEEGKGTNVVLRIPVVSSEETV